MGPFSQIWGPFEAKCVVKFSNKRIVRAIMESLVFSPQVIVVRPQLKDMGVYDWP